MDIADILYNILLRDACRVQYSRRTSVKFIERYAFGTVRILLTLEWNGRFTLFFFIYTSCKNFSILKSLTRHGDTLDANVGYKAISTGVSEGES